ncbi:hypothetical protein BJF93_22715 [Xaviernesmea oryzae]|uniref:HARP domain-containing protein n=1 Tax=Xaviernesmea oryzae TaxID=464029 RepID=A0A1Q9B378_9HYPH|nr:hypothetical protein [Xaviernesmea oryzae]OLP62471.1 hypothetical protein BJF93_22715 [Xaviernesmea oryzae]SEM17587.1 hypothetical protein SAMN04487976_12173 [Xaviernesmea oryzae]
MSDDRSEPKDDAPAETVSFPFDRMTVARFREQFPQARWSDRLNAWQVPGKTARRRIDRWLAEEAGRRRPFEEEKGRDAYAWEPILSPYLQVSDRGFIIRTPYSRTVVDALRQVPFARWNSEEKAWEVPFASYDELQHRWEAIEAAAKRNEPDERRKRAEARKGTEDEAKARRRSSERRRRRLPVPSLALPPLDRPLATSVYGIVVITEITGELVDPSEVAEHYPAADEEHVWAGWRAPTLDELVHTWPAKIDPSALDRLRGWWQPTLEELRSARRTAKARERRAKAELTDEPPSAAQPN